MVFLESLSSVFWFQPVWSLCTGGQHAVNFLHLVVVGFLISSKQVKNMCQDNIYSTWGGTRVLDLVLWVSYYYFVLLDCFPLFLHFLTFIIINWLNLFWFVLFYFILFYFWIWGRPRRLKLFYKQEVRDTGRESVPRKTPQCSAWFHKDNLLLLFNLDTFFLFLSWLLWFRLPVLFWIGVVIVGNLILFLL